MSNTIGQEADIRLALAKARVFWLIATSDSDIADGQGLEYVTAERELLQAAALAWPDVPAAVIRNLATMGGPEEIAYGIQMWRDQMTLVRTTATRAPDDAPKPSDWELKNNEGWWTR